MIQVFSSPEKRVVILGAGPAGLTAAYQLAKAGATSCTLEANDDVGGISRTVSYKGNHFDIGGHRFFTKVACVEEMWREVIAESDYLRRSRLSRIYYNSKFFYYPLRIGNALRGLGPLNSLRIGASFLRARAFPKKNEVSFEDWVCNRFGRRLYETFFRTYTEKVWGMPCSEISSEWAAQRIRGLSLSSAVRSAIVHRKGVQGGTRQSPGGSSNGSDVIKTLIDEFDYPRLGPGMMWRATRDRVVAAGSEVRLGSQVGKVHWRDGGVTGVEVTGRDGAIELVEGTDFLSSLPIRELINQLDPPAPKAVLAAAARLRYRDFLTVSLIVDDPDLFADNWIYIHDPTVRVGRIQNFKNWSPDMVADPSQTVLGLEYFCFEGDGLWNMDDSALIDLAADELARLGLSRRELVVDGTVVRQPKAYPVYDATHKDALATVRTFLREQLPNLQLMGRNGMHKYNNQDHSMLTAMMAAQNVLGANHDLWEVNEEQRYHEELQPDEAAASRQLAAAEATQPHVPMRASE